MSATRYYKATDSEGRSWGNPAITWEVGKITRDPLPAGRRKICAPGLLHAATVPTESLASHARITLPPKLWVVEPYRCKVVADPGHPHKVGARAWRSVEELPGHLAFGPQGEEILALIERCKTLTSDEVGRLAAAWVAARAAAWNAARGVAGGVAGGAARGEARDAARVAAWNAARDAARVAAWNAAGDAALALVVRDLISVKDFALLYGPWKAVMG